MGAFSEEIAVLLALPPDARKALTKCAGPGWVVPRFDHIIEPVCPLAIPYDQAWLPADTAAILMVAELGGVMRATLWRHDGFGWRAAGLNQPPGDPQPSARLAALRLVAAVWGAP